MARPCRANTNVAHARTRVPFTRASSAGLAGKRVIGCLRSVATSFMTPRQTEQRSGPEGPRSRVPGGIAKGGWASSPPWLAGEGERRVARRHEWLAAVRCWRRRGHGMPCRYENGEAVRNGRRAPYWGIPTRSVGTIGERLTPSAETPKPTPPKSPPSRANSTAPSDYPKTDNPTTPSYPASDKTDWSR